MFNIIQPSIHSICKTGLFDQKVKICWRDKHGGSLAVLGDNKGTM